RRRKARTRGSPEPPCRPVRLLVGTRLPPLADRSSHRGAVRRVDSALLRDPAPQPFDTNGRRGDDFLGVRSHSSPQPRTVCERRRRELARANIVVPPFDQPAPISRWRLLKSESSRLPRWKQRQTAGRELILIGSPSGTTAPNTAGGRLLLGEEDLGSRLT